MKAILINTTDDLGHHGCTLVNRQIMALATNAEIDIVARFSLHADWDALAPDQFDAVIVNGEGTLHSSSKGARRIAEVPAWAKEHRVPAHLINSVYQNNDAYITEGIASFDTITVRDNLSAAQLSEAGIKTEIVPDLSLTWRPKPATLGGKPHLNGSTLKDVRASMFALRSREMPYLSIVARPPKGSEKLTKYRIKRAASVITPFAFWRHSHAIPDFDKFEHYLRHEVSGIITGRFHMATIALCLEIPVVAVPSITHKMQSLFDMLDMPYRLTNDVSTAASLLRDYTDDERARIRDFRRDTDAKAKASFIRLNSH